MKKAEILIIGAGRSGTTSLYEYMDHHPDINFSITKELHYFSIPDLYQRGEEYFHSLFTKSENKIYATADTYLLIDKIAPERIKAYNPDMKIIVMMREPVSRSYSNFNYSKNFGHEEQDISFIESLEKEPERLKNKDIVYLNNLCHFYGSLYYKHLNYWGQYFKKDQIILLKLDDLKKDPESFYSNLSQMLNIAYYPVKTDITKYNAATGVKSKGLQQFLLNRNSKARKMISFLLRPFRKIIIKSGIIEKIYTLNKKQIDIPPLAEKELAIAKKYFSDDLRMLQEEYKIIFNES